VTPTPALLHGHFCIIVNVHPRHVDRQAARARRPQRVDGVDAREHARREGPVELRLGERPVAAERVAAQARVAALTLQRAAASKMWVMLRGLSMASTM
jgi:hypothetical protein